MIYLLDTLLLLFLSVSRSLVIYLNKSFFPIFLSTFILFLNAAHFPVRFSPSIFLELMICLICIFSFLSLSFFFLVGDSSPLLESPYHDSTSEMSESESFFPCILRSTFSSISLYSYFIFFYLVVLEIIDYHLNAEVFLD